MRSSRLPPNLTANAIARAVEARRGSNRDLIDLTESNPTRVGLAYPPDLLAPLADPSGLTYDPQPLGLLVSAREAVAREFAPPRPRRCDPDRVALTSSTSEAYALLFKLFCDPGDQVLVPHPSYPLFDHLTRLEAVGRRALRAWTITAAWRIDLASVEGSVNAANASPAGGVAQQPDWFLPSSGGPARAGRNLPPPRSRADWRRGLLRLQARRRRRTR